MILLSNFEWSTWSTAEIARQCNVSENFVSKLRKGKEPDIFKYKNSEGETVERKRNKPKEENTNKKEDKKQEQKPKIDDEKLDQANAAIEILVQENQQLIDKLATKDSSDPKVADLHIADLRQQIKELESENKSLVISRNQFQNENDELKKQIKWLEKKIKKLETEII
jgi:chromosome segregation ATPase